MTVTVTATRPRTPPGSLVDFVTDSTGHPIFSLSPLAIHISNVVADPRSSVVVEMPGWRGLANARVTMFGELYQLPKDLQPVAKEMFQSKFNPLGRVCSFPNGAALSSFLSRTFPTHRPTRQRCRDAVGSMNHARPITRPSPAGTRSSLPGTSSITEWITSRTFTSSAASVRCSGWTRTSSGRP